MNEYFTHSSTAALLHLVSGINPPQKKTQQKSNKTIEKKTKEVNVHCSSQNIRKTFSMWRNGSRMEKVARREKKTFSDVNHILLIDK